MSESAPLPSPPSRFSIAEPRQARSRRTLDRIVTAARELFAERGTEGVTVLEIVERAGSSVGSFYARFPGKEELVGYLNQRVRREAVEEWEAAVSARDWQALDLEATVEALTGILLGFCCADAGWRRAFTGADGEGPGGPAANGAEAAHPSGREAADAPERGLQDRILDDFLRLLLRSRDRITHPDPDLAVRIGFRILVGGIRELLAPGPGIARGPGIAPGPGIACGPGIARGSGIEGGAGSPGGHPAGGAERPRTPPLDDARIAVELSRSYLAYLAPRTDGDGDPLMDDPFNIWT